MSEATEYAERQANDLKARTRRDCKTLYPDGKFSWECGPGWARILARLSYRLECANRLFKKNFLVHVEADQVKEKFGELRFYYSIGHDIPPLIERLHVFLCRSADVILRTADFRAKRIVKQRGGVVVKCREIDPAVEDDPFAWSFTAPDGFTCSVKKIHRPETAELVATRLRFLWIVAHACRRLAATLEVLYSGDLNRQNVGAEALDGFVEKSVRKAEEECYSVCEDCGRPIGEDYSPRCQTVGWISYICEDCAKAQGRKYVKNKTMYKDGRPVEQQKDVETGGDAP